MGFDSRHLVLEFLAENRTLGINQMTLIFFGKKSDSFLQESLSQSDKVFVYHSKGTRLFWKEYGYDLLTGSIIELLLDNKSAMNLTKNNLSFKITEPYYFLDLRNFDFDYLSVIPVEENDDLIGYAMLYGSLLIEEEMYPNVSLRRLFRNIVKNEIQAKYKEFDNVLENEYGYLEFRSKLYLSKNLAESLNITQKQDVMREDFYLLLSKNDYIETDVIEKTEYIIHKLEKNTRILLALDEINKLDYVAEFTLFYIVNNQSQRSLSQLLDLVAENINLSFPNDKAKYYKVSDDSLAVILKKKYLKKQINGFKGKIKDSLVIDIRSFTDLPNKANLEYVLKYLNEEQRNCFKYEEYQKYRLNKVASKYL